MAELDELLARFGAGDRTWELGARLAAVLAADGRAAQIPPILAQCRPLKMESIGADCVVAHAGFTGWRLPQKLGRSAILDLGPDGAHEVRLGDRFVIEAAGFALVRSMGEPVATVAGNVDTSLESALATFAAAIGATLEHA